VGLFDDLLEEPNKPVGQSPGLFDDLLAAAPPAAPQDGNDFMNALKIGAQKVPGAVTGLLDIPAGLAGFDRPFDKLADKAGEATGFQPEQWAKENRKNYSAGLQQSMGEVDRVWDDKSQSWISKAAQTLQHPGVLGAKLVESLPGIAMGGAYARGMKLAGSAMGAVKRGAIGEGAVAGGQAMSETDPTVSPQRAALASAAAGGATAGIGVLAGRLAHRLGLSDIDTLVAGGAARAGESAAAKASRVKRFFQAAGQEGLLEEMPQSAVEQMASNWAEGRPLMEGVDRAATEGAMLGSALGGGLNAVTGGRRADPEQSQKDAPEDPAASTTVDGIIDESRAAVAARAQNPEGTPDAPSPATPPAVSDPSVDIVSIPPEVASDQVQTNGSEPGPDAGAGVAGMGLSGERQAVPADLATPERGGALAGVGAAGGNHAGEGADVPALNAQGRPTREWFTDPNSAKTAPGEQRRLSRNWFTNPENAGRLNPIEHQPRPIENVVAEAVQPVLPAAAAPLRNTPTLPKPLAGAKPRYGYGSDLFEVEFADDVQKAAYIAAGIAKRSSRDADYVAFVRDALGYSEGQVRTLGNEIRKQIKELAKTQLGSDNRVIDLRQLPGTVMPAAAPTVAPSRTVPVLLKPFAGAKPRYVPGTVMPAAVPTVAPQRPPAPNTASGVLSAPTPVITPQQPKKQPKKSKPPNPPVPPAQGGGQQPPPSDPVDRSIFAGRTPEPKRGPLGRAVHATKQGVKFAKKHGLVRSFQELHDRFIANELDFKHGATRNLEQAWTRMTPEGKRVATARAKSQLMEYRHQIGGVSISEGYLDYNSEGIPHAVSSPVNIQSMWKKLQEIDTGPLDKETFVNGFMANLAQWEHEQKLKKRQAAAQAELDNIAHALTQVNKPQDVQTLMNRARTQKEILKDKFERPKGVDDVTMQQALRLLQQDEKLRDFVAMNRTLNHKDIDFALRSGKITPEVAQAWKENDFYSPMRRVMEEEDDPKYDTPHRQSGMAASRDYFKPFGGSKRDVESFFDNLMGQRMLLADSAIQNDGLMAMANELVELGVPGINFHKHHPNHAKNVVPLFDRGERVYLQIDDPLTFKAFQDYQKIDAPGMQLIEGVTHFFREAIMLSPDAIARNVTRDIEEAWLYNYTSKNPASAATDVIRQIMTHDVAGRALPRADVVQFGITGHREDVSTQREIERLRRRVRNEMGRGRDWGERAANALEAAWSSVYHRMENVSMRAELGTRNHIYQDVLKRTGSETEAALAAINLLDFRRRGAAKHITFLKQSIPFINSNLQGIHKIHRALIMGENLGMSTSDARKLLAYKGGKILAVSVAYTLMMAGDDEEGNPNEYLQADQKMRDTSILVPLPGAEKGTFLRIPLPFELGSIFWSAPQALTLRVMGRSDNNELKRSLKYLLDHAMPGVPIPQAFKPALEVMFNHDTFTDSRIVPLSEQDKSPRNQMRESSTELAKAAGDQFNISPMKVDHILRGYFGTLGQYAMTGVDIGVNMASGSTKAPKPWHRYPGLKSFLTDPLNSQHKNDLYEMRTRTAKVAADVKHFKKKFDQPGLTAYLEQQTDGMPNKKLLGAHQHVDRATRKLAQIRSQREVIENHPELTGEQRRLQLDQLRRQEKEMLNVLVPKLKRALGEE
jgi:hypothetical protein